MDLKIECSCGQHLAVPAEAVGQRVKCPACGAELIVPGPGTAQSPEPTASVNEIAETGHSTGGRRKGLVVVLVVVGVIIVTGAAVMVWDAQTKDRRGVSAQAGTERTAAHPGAHQTVGTSGTAASDTPKWTGSAPRPSTQPRKVTIDARRLCPLIDGQPFFAIGVCGIPEQFMKEAADAGFNLTMRWGSGGSSAAAYKKAEAGGDASVRTLLQGYLDAAKAAGLWVVDWPSLYGGVADQRDFKNPAFVDHYIDKFVPNRLPFLIDTVKDHPALFGYYSIDEPPPEQPRVREACAAFAKAVRARDPAHPIYLFFNGWPETCDIGGLDCYPTPNETPLIWLYQTVRRTAQQAHGLQKPYWFVPLMESFENGPPGALHQQAQTYLSVIAGANGLIWWWWPPMHTENWAMFQQLTKELGALTPVITEPPAPTQVRYEPSSLRNTIQVRAIRHENRTWLITANATKTHATARFTLPATVRGPAKVWFENREIALAGRQFTDRFDGFSRHVYEVAAQWPPETEIGLNLTLHPLAAEASLPPDRGPLSPNLLKDPGFENNSHWRFVPAGFGTGKRQGRFDEASRHGGRRSAMVEWTDASGPADWNGTEVKLKPNTGYTFGGWAKAEVQGRVGNQSVIMILRTSKGWLYHTTLGIDHFAPWRNYNVVFRTGEQPVTVRPALRVNAYSKPDAQNSGKAWFDDLFLVEASAGVRNMIFNGGFEGPQYLPGWPRGWNYENPSYAAPGAMGSPESLWGLDESHPYEGRYSLRMTNKEKRTLIPPLHYQVARYDFPLGTILFPERDYVFSAWMRTDTPDLPVTLRTGDWDKSKTVRLTTEWRRYVHAVRRSEPVQMPHVAVVCGRGQGTVWIDAVQFEEGTEPTDYREWGE